MALNITTRQTELTHPETNTNATSTNAGVALTNVQMDQNLINIKHLVDLNTSRLNKSHDANGSITDLVIEADDLKPNSVDYSKLKSIHYVPATDGSTSINDTAVNEMKIKVNSLTSPLETGTLFFVKALITKVDAEPMKITISNSTEPIITNAAIVKGPFDNNDGLALIAGDIRQGQVAALLYDGTSFQLINPTRPLVAFVADPTVQQENTDPTAVVNTAAIVELLTKLKAAGIMATS